MSRRIKLTTEWVEWVATPYLQWRLTGGMDYVAVIFHRENSKCDLRIYVNAVRSMTNDTTWMYDEPHDFGPYAGREDAITACEQKLIEFGLVDIIGWISQCED